MNVEHAGWDVLVVVAHPDDETLCAAGTLALCAERGMRTAVVCATRGEHGPISDPALLAGNALGQIRERELRASCEVLGVQHVELLDLPDGAVEWAAPAQHTAQTLGARIRQLRPRVLIGFGPDGLYGHRDHVALGQLLSEARQLSADPAVDLDLGREVPRPYRVPRHFFAVWTAAQVRALLDQLAHAGTPGQLWGLRPEHFHVTAREVTARVDVSSVMSRKLRAMRCHQTQLARDHAFLLVGESAARETLGIEHFRCADGRPGSPLDP